MSSRTVDHVPIGRIAPVCMLHGECQSFCVARNQNQIHSAVRITLQKKTTTIAALGHMVRYSNGYHSRQASHNWNSSKKMSNEVMFRFSSCLPARRSPELQTKFVGKLPVRPPVFPVGKLPVRPPVFPSPSFP